MGKSTINDHFQSLCLFTKGYQIMWNVYPLRISPCQASDTRISFSISDLRPMTLRIVFSWNALQLKSLVSSGNSQTLILPQDNTYHQISVELFNAWQHTVSGSTWVQDCKISAQVTVIFDCKCSWQACPKRCSTCSLINVYAFQQRSKRFRKQSQPYGM